MMVLPVSRSPLSIASMPSRRRASANFESPLMWCWTRSLKFFVGPIARLRAALSALALLVVLPIGVGRIDIALLALLGAAGQQDHQRRTVLPEINTVARPEIDPVFAHALADRFDAGEVTLLQPDDGARDLGSRYRLQIRKPRGERLLAVCGHVVAYFRHLLR